MRFRRKNYYFLAVALSAGCAVMHGDSLNGSGSLQTWSSSNLVDGSMPTAGAPYWNNSSGDGPKENVGWCISGGGNCSMLTSPQAALPYFGNGSSSAGLMYFTSTGGAATVNVQTLSTDQTTIAGGYDVFGYYVANGSGSAAGATLTPLFDTRTNTVGSSQTLQSMAAGANYGFYIENIQGGGTQFQSNYIYFMDSASNTADGSMPADGLQHFAAFTSGNGTYFLGDVDGDACQGTFMPGTSPCVPASQFDYNDVVIEVSTSGGANTPEPASLALLGGGLCGIAGLMSKRKMRVEN